MRPYKTTLTEEELLSLREHLNPNITYDYLQLILKEYEEKPVWHKKDFQVPETDSLTICYRCRRLYEITPNDDEMFLLDRKTGKSSPYPYCERDAMIIMGRELDSQ